MQDLSLPQVLYITDKYKYDKIFKWKVENYSIWVSTTFLELASNSTKNQKMMCVELEHASPASYTFLF